MASYYDASGARRYVDIKLALMIRLDIASSLFW